VNLKSYFEKYNMGISALDCHVNPVHPDEKANKAVNKNLNDTILLAEKLGVKNVVTFAGCPGEPGGHYPNWVVQPWPTEFEELYKWQWNEVVIPYWKEKAKFAEAHNVTMCIEMHPGFVVYNPETMLKLYNAVGSEAIGCTFDPSNIVWQGVDVPTAIRTLGHVIKHFHAKDSIESMHNIAVNGRLDAKNYSERTKRAWSFRTVGYGHDEFYWKKIMSELVDAEYEGAISIEHEDTYMNNIEGLTKAVDFLKKVMIREKAGELTWANTDNMAKAEK
jgi:sugar phosphate isomerase/epimerase